MKKWTSGLLTAVVTMSITACTAVKDSLDMRCQDVNERVRMHEGTPWHLTKWVPYGKKMFQLQNKGVESKYCDAPKGTKPDEVRLAAMELEVEGYDETQAFVPYDDGAVCKWKGQPPDPKYPQTAELAKQRYLQNREIYLSSKAIRLGEDIGDAPIYLASRSLNCTPPGDDLSKQWRCQKIDPEENPGAAGSILEQCYKDRIGGIKFVINYVGVIADRYCLYLSVREEKPGPNKNRGKPTSINRDELVVGLACAERNGQSPAGVIVGGPRPEFRMPPAPRVAVESE